jgi:DNA replication protein DnaC
VRYDVPVGHADFGKAFPCQCQQETDEEQLLARFQRYSNMGMLARATFASTEPEGRGTAEESRARFRVAFDAARNYAEEPHGWFTLMGASGTGKTHLAAAIANRCMERGIPAFFTLVPDLLDHLRGTFSPDNEVSYDDLFDQVKGVPLLVLDDLGVQKSTPWAQEKLFQVLNHRYVNSLSTVITTNVPLEQMDARLHSRLEDPRVSRVMDLGVSTRRSVAHIGKVEPEMLAHMTFEAFDPQGKAVEKGGKETLAAALTAANSFAQEPQGWLVFAGDSGCGKTHLAVAVTNERLKRGHAVFFTFVPDLLDHLRYTFSPESRVTYDELFDQVKQAPLLVLDDLGAESSTAWAHEKLYQIIVHRHNAKLPTVITTRGISDNPKDPVASRINDPRLVTVVPITAPSYRQQSRRSPPASRVRGSGPPPRER